MHESVTSSMNICVYAIYVSIEKKRKRREKKPVQDKEHKKKTQRVQRKRGKKLRERSLLCYFWFNY